MRSDRGVVSQAAKERWHEIDAVLKAALDVPAGRRLAYVRSRTIDDQELCRSVEALLRAGDEAGGFLETPLDLDSQTWLAATDRFFATGVARFDAASRIGQTIGTWRLVEELGRGGMARVFLAERTGADFEQRAALKLLRPDIDAEVVERFRAERQILSNLAHPHISSLLDGGSTADGQPYLVMEAVDGRPITEWCDGHRLSVRGRVELFQDVLSAVEYAHANLVVHRDLKPSNILVTADGRVKLLDFGIAQMLEADGPDGTAASTERLLLTPEYASPEQVTGKPISTASDTYQLGLLLYRILVGRRPYDVSTDSRDDLRRSVLEGVAAPMSEVAGRLESAEAAVRRSTPRRLVRQLRGDLDAVVLRAVRKDPAQRYASVTELDSDLADYLASRPVAAAEGGLAYRVAKYFKRHRWALPALGAAAVAATVYVGVQRAHEYQLESERNAARTAADRAEAAKVFMVELFRSADPWASPDPDRGRNVTVREALGTGADRARNELSGQPGIRADLLASIGAVYENLGLSVEGLPLVTEALVTAQGSQPVDEVRVAALQLQLGRLFLSLDQTDSARVVFGAALQAARTLAAPHDTAVAMALAGLGTVAFDEGTFDQAEGLYRRADSLLAQHPSAASSQRARLQYGLATVYPAMNELAKARAAARLNLSLTTDAFGAGDPRTAAALIKLADVLDLSDRDDESVEIYERAIATLERALGEEHDATLQSLNNLAITLGEVGRGSEAEQVLRRVLEIRSRKTGIWHRDVGDAMQNLAVTLRIRGNLSEAQDLLTRAHRVYSAVLPDGHLLTAYPLLTRSSIELDRRDYRAAASTTALALEVLEPAQPDHVATAMARCRRGRALLGLERFREAEPLLRAGTAVAADAPQLPPDYRTECLDGLARVLEATGRPAEAQPYRIAIAQLDDAKGY